ncbi:SMEK domain-containing protein [Pseudomonas sp. S11A4]|uniref:SMEK domain-containing protein n=1 Tax=Pseudomonas sp. S11A4 TaxID=1476791 RepID=UPI00215C7614|nr:SMEK domain-containing protein [Pseudomonas sp. S11A4]MCR8935276.1 tetratricopeptide repeat protein [Pseudomonas sp. S11A4]
MLERKRLISELEAYFGVLDYIVANSGRRGRYDAHVHSEDFVASILNALHGWKLKNVNNKASNIAAIDLLDSEVRVGVQVSSDKTSSKVNSTIKKLLKSSLRSSIDELIIFLLQSKQKSYTINTDCPGVRFFEENIWDYDTVLSFASNSSTGPELLEAVHAVVVKSFGDWPGKNWISETSKAAFGADLASDESSRLLERSFGEGEQIKARVILLIEKNEAKEAQRLLDEYAASYTTVAAQNFYDIASLYSLLKSDKADTYYSRAISLEPRSAAKANLYAIGLMRQGQLAKAVLIYKEWLKDPELSMRDRAGFLGNLGFIYKKMGHYDQSAEHFKQSISIARNSSDLLGAIKNLNGLGSCYINMQRYDNARTYLYEARDLLEEEMLISEDEATLKIYRSLKSNLLTNLGILYKYTKEPAKARDFYRQGIDLARSMGDSQALYRNYGNLANAYQAVKDYGRAREFGMKAYEMAVELKDIHGQCTALTNLGSVDNHDNKFDSAQNYLEKALLIEGGNFPKTRATIFANLAFAYKAKGEHDKMHNSFKAAEQLYVEMNLKDSLRWLHAVFSDDIRI